MSFQKNSYSLIWDNFIATGPIAMRFGYVPKGVSTTLKNYSYVFRCVSGDVAVILLGGYKNAPDLHVPATLVTIILDQLSQYRSKALYGATTLST